MNDKLHFWCKSPRWEFHADDSEKPPPTNNEDEVPPFPKRAELPTLTGFVDSSHGSDIAARRSVTDTVFMLTGAAVAW